MRMTGPTGYLAGIRTTLGVAALTAPRVTSRVFGVDPVRQPAIPYLARLFGIRDVVLALGLARIDDLRSPRGFLLVNVLVDVTDAASGLAAGRRRELPRVTTVMVTVPAVVAAGLGVAAILERTRG